MILVIKLMCHSVHWVLPQYVGHEFTCVTVFFRHTTELTVYTKRFSKSCSHITYINLLISFLFTAMAQWLRRRTCAQRTWVYFLLVPMWVIGGGRKGVRPKLVPCASKDSTLIGTSQPLCKGVNDFKFGRTLLMQVFELSLRRSQETQLSLTNRATRLEVSQGHQTWNHSIC